MTSGTGPSSAIPGHLLQYGRAAAQATGEAASPQLYPAISAFAAGCRAYGAAVVPAATELASNVDTYFTACQRTDEQVWNIGQGFADADARTLSNAELQLYSSLVTLGNDTLSARMVSVAQLERQNDDRTLIAFVANQINTGQDDLAWVLGVFGAGEYPQVVTNPYLLAQLLNSLDQVAISTFTDRIVSQAGENSTAFTLVAAALATGQVSSSFTTAFMRGLGWPDDPGDYYQSGADLFFLTVAANPAASQALIGQLGTEYFQSAIANGDAAAEAVVVSANLDAIGQGDGANGWSASDLQNFLKDVVRRANEPPSLGNPVVLPYDPSSAINTLITEHATALGHQPTWTQINDLVHNHIDPLLTNYETALDATIKSQDDQLNAIVRTWSRNRNVATRSRARSDRRSSRGNRELGPRHLHPRA